MKVHGCVTYVAVSVIDDKALIFSIVDEIGGMSSSVKESNVAVRSDESPALLLHPDDLSLPSDELSSIGRDGSSSDLACFVSVPFVIRFGSAHPNSKSSLFLSTFSSMQSSLLANNPATHAAITIATAAVTPMIAAGGRDFCGSFDWPVLPLDVGTIAENFSSHVTTDGLPDGPKGLVLVEVEPALSNDGEWIVVEAEGGALKSVAAEGLGSTAVLVPV